MELRQLRYFVRIVELGSFSRAAAALGLVTSALSQQITRLESELSTRLLHRSTTGVQPTDAGLAFLRQAQLALRHADAAVSAARDARLTGQVSIGLAPTTASVLGLPLIAAMRERYPYVRLRIVEALSGDLAQLLNARLLDVAVVFRAEGGQRWHVAPLLDERLFLIGAPLLPRMPTDSRTRLSALAHLPLILPSPTHDLRSVVDAAFRRARSQPHVVLEIDGLAMLMEAVAAGVAATIQPGAATARSADGTLAIVPIADAHARRRNLLATLSEDELSPAALAARVVLLDVARRLVDAGRWIGARFHDS
ncbi:tricarballylate utilization LysR family transcriptional regulator TcuR [soil metagenome]